MSNKVLIAIITYNRSDLLERCIKAALKQTYTETELLILLNDHEIDIRFLGSDYQGKKFTGMELNIPIHYLDRSHGWSTTKYTQLLVKSLTD